TWVSAHCGQVYLMPLMLLLWRVRCYLCSAVCVERNYRSASDKALVAASAAPLIHPPAVHLQMMSSLLGTFYEIIIFKLMRLNSFN
ncbi:MAG TPA: hypothetical protein VMU10_06405, partial [Desulfomonilia bacterium]|nr:hypothetical protein [Desulfomonilia bacterium]